MSDFSTYPLGSKVGGTFIDATPTKVGSSLPSFIRRLLIYGEPNKAMIADLELKPKRMVVSNDAKIYGEGSMLSHMIECSFLYSPNIEIWALPVVAKDASASVATIAITGTSSKSGTLSLYINNIRIAISIPVGTTNIDAVAIIIQAISSNIKLPITAITDDVNEGTVIFNSKWEGGSSNDITIALNITDSDKLNVPSNITFIATEFNCGLGEVSLENTFTLWGEHYFTLVCSPYHDATNIEALSKLADELYSAKEMRPFQFVSGTNINRDNYLSLVEPLNNKYLTIGWVESTITPKYIIASSFATFIENSHTYDPAVAYNGVVKNIRAGIDIMRKFDEKNQIVLAGGCLTNNNDDGTVGFQKIVTTYKRDENGEPDDVFSLPQTMAKLQCCIFELLSTFQRSPYIAAVLVADEMSVLNKNAVRPIQAKSSLMGLIKDWSSRGMLNNADYSIDNLEAYIYEKDSSKLVMKLVLLLSSPLEEKAILLEFTNEFLG